jgi:hypothetical protein
MTPVNQPVYFLRCDLQPTRQLYWTDFLRCHLVQEEDFGCGGDAARTADLETGATRWLALRRRLVGGVGG